MSTSFSRIAVALTGVHQPTKRIAAAVCAIVLGVCGILPTQAADSKNAKPDFSGVYRSYRAPAGAAGVGAVARERQELPALKPGPQAKVDEIKQVLEGTGENGGAWCLGYGMPGSMLGSGGYPMEVIQRPEQITFIYEAHNEIRRVYIGDDNQLPEADRFPDRNGYSRGWWEGDELVVETTSLKELLDGRYPHSENAKVIERYHAETDKNGNKILAATLTMTDPDFYTKTVEMDKRWRLDSDAKMMPYECDEPTWYDRIDEIRELKKQGKEIPVR